MTIDWRPTAWFVNRPHINELSSPLIRFHRPPKLRPGDPEAPTLPGFDISIGKLQVDPLWFGPRIAGQPRTASMIGEADDRSGRALVRLASPLRARSEVQAS